MKFIAIDSSNAHLTVAADNGIKNKIVHIEKCDRSHSAVLMPQVDIVLKELGMTVTDLDFIGVCVGPGSFTGIRIGIAAVKGLALAHKKGIKCVTAFDVIAYNIKGKMLACIDASGGKFYIQAYENGKTAGEPQVAGKDEIKEFFPKYPIFTASKTDAAISRIADIKTNFYNLIKCAPLSETVEPLYVRKSQAEEKKVYDIEKSDLVKIARLEKEIFKDPWNLAMLEGSFESQGFCGILTKDSSEITAYSAMNIAADGAEILFVATNEKHRKRGLAKKLIGELEKRAKHKNVKTIFLEVRESNTAAIALYQKCGFLPIGRRVRYYCDGENAVTMKKEI